MAEWRQPPSLEWSRAHTDQGIDIEWAGIAFASQHLRGDFPRWSIEDTNWWDGTAEDTETMRALRGEMDLVEHYPSRMVSWSGKLYTWTYDELLEQMQDFQAAQGKSLRVWEAGFGRQATCRKSAASITPLTDRIATYTVTVVLPDPLIHSIDELELNQSVSVRNAGNTRSYPRVTVVGPTAAGPKVTIGSWSTTAPRALVDGETFIVDTRQQDLFIGGSRVFPILTDFGSISTGDTVTISTDRGTGTVEGVSAWI